MSEWFPDPNSSPNTSISPGTQASPSSPSLGPNPDALLALLTPLPTNPCDLLDLRSHENLGKGGDGRGRGKVKLVRRK